MAENEDLGLNLHLCGSLESATQTIKGRQYGSTSYGSVLDNGVGILNLIGPIYPRANAMTSSGAVSLAKFTQEFMMMANDPEIIGMVLNIDSPGGDTRGIGDASNMMYQMAQKRKKPMKAFASGFMASASYHLGATMQSIVGSKTSITGSIGVVLSGQKLPDGSYEIVASQSPNKRPDGSTPEGQAVLQRLVDDLASSMIEDIATFRGITPEKVLSNYGQGETMVGPRAKQSGLIDSIGTLSGVVEQVAKEAQTNSYRQVKPTKKVSAEIAEILQFSTQELDDMGLKALAQRFKADAGTILDEAANDQQAQSATATDQESEGSVADEGQGPNASQGVQPPVSREEAEEQFSEAAELFSLQMVTDHRLFPAQQVYAASALLNAKIDDKLYPAAVSYADKEGQIVEGTREDAVRATFESLPQHSMTKRAIAGVKDGSIQAKVLKEETPEDKGKGTKEEEGPLSEERRDYLLGLTQQGQRALAQNK